MDEIILLRWLHIIGATVLFGTGMGIAFFMVIAHRTGDPRFIGQTARTVVLADWCFTATAVILQPITGALLAWRLGWSLLEGWILLSLILYGVAGAFWLPVVWIQQRMGRLAREAAVNGQALPARYFALYRIWFAFGFPAFSAVLAILYLMIARPIIW